MGEISIKSEAGGLSSKEAGFPESPKMSIPQERRTPESNLLAILNRYDKFIALANQKASFLIGSSGVLLGVAIIERTKILFATEMTCITWLNGVLYLIAVLGLFGVLICSLIVAFPITGSGAKVGEYTSLIAYSSVAEMKIETFESKLSSTDYDFWSDIVHQTHELAKITASKFKVLKWATGFALISVSSIVLLFIMATLK
ncbi:MAG: Pycsar system effector family protein [Thermodesulfobacteriota bacterium]|jgi:hypothetical protein